MDKKRIIQVDEKVPLPMLLPLSIQHVFAMFGASVLVPILFQIDPGIVLFMNGFGTLLFIFLTKGKAPAYLGSSFAFLAPAGGVIAAQGFGYAQGGFVGGGLLGCLLAFLVWKFGTAWIDVILPPAAMGPVVALIGLELAGKSVFVHVGFHLAARRLSAVSYYRRLRGANRRTEMRKNFAALPVRSAPGWKKEK